jgi:hypothetical protein
MNYKNILLGALTIALTACSSESNPDAAATSAIANSPAKVARVDDPTARMARAVGTGKPGAAVDIKYEFLARPTVGKPIELDLALIPNAGVTALDIVVTGMEGVTLAGDLTAAFADVKAGQPYKHKLSLLAQREGVFYLTVAATTQIGGASMGRTFSIPFVVGTPAAKEKPAAPAKDATGQAIESMPAKESTR